MSWSGGNHSWLRLLVRICNHSDRDYEISQHAASQTSFHPAGHWKSYTHQFLSWTFAHIAFLSLGIIQIRGKAGDGSINNAGCGVLEPYIIDPSYTRTYHVEHSTNSNNMTQTMEAVVFKGPLQVALEQRPIPQLHDPTDVILKVRYSALCGR